MVRLVPKFVMASSSVSGIVVAGFGSRIIAVGMTVSDEHELVRGPGFLIAARFRYAESLNIDTILSRISMVNPTSRARNDASVDVVDDSLSPK